MIIQPIPQHIYANKATNQVAILEIEATFNSKLCYVRGEF